MKAKLLKKLSDYFRRQPNVIVAYLHGSYARGIARAASDVDIAVLFSRMPDFFEISRLQTELSEIAKKEVDLSILNNASPIFARQVLEKGVEVYCRVSREKNKFILKTLNEYDDLKYYRQQIEKNILKGRIFAR